MSKDYNSGENIKVKTFTIRLMHDETTNDTKKMNEFLSKIDTRQMYTNIIEGKVDIYAYSIRYVEKQKVKLKKKRKKIKPDLNIN